MMMSQCSILSSQQDLMTSYDITMETMVDCCWVDPQQTLCPDKKQVITIYSQQIAE